MIEWEKSVIDGNVETRHGRAGKLKFSIKVMEYREFGNPNNPIKHLVEINYQIGGILSWPIDNTLHDCQTKEQAFIYGINLMIKQLQRSLQHRISEVTKLEECLVILAE